MTRLEGPLWTLIGSCPVFHFFQLLKWRCKDSSNSCPPYYFINFMSFFRSCFLCVCPSLLPHLFGFSLLRPFFICHSIDPVEVETPSSCPHEEERRLRRHNLNWIYPTDPHILRWKSASYQHAKSSTMNIWKEKKETSFPPSQEQSNWIILND